MKKEKQVTTYHNHYEICNIDIEKDKNPRFIIDTQNTISVGDVIQINDQDKSIIKYLVKYIVHNVYPISTNSNKFSQEDGWNTYLYVEEMEIKK